MQHEGLVKSIIYGNSFVNSYGLFRALCAAVSDKEHIDKIIFYLRAADNFRKFNKYVYAFRIEEANPVFVTETNKGPKHFLEGFNEDVTLEGNGEKLLHLIQKFNVRNVIVIVAIAQKDPLHEFNAEHHMTVVKAAKDLLNSLYDKVARSEDHAKSILSKEPIQRKLFVLPDIYQPPKFRDYKAREDNRPNYVSACIIPEPPKAKKELQKGTELRYLNEKIKDWAYKLETLLDQLGPEEDASLKFNILYDEAEDTLKVIKLLLVLFGVESKSQLVRTGMSTMLREISVKTLSNKIINNLNLMLLGDPSLKSSKIRAGNASLGMIVEFIEVLMRSYSFAKKIAMLETSKEMETLAQDSHKVKPKSKSNPRSKIKSKSSISKRSIGSQH